MADAFNDDGIRILSAVFGEQWLEISFVEERDESTDIVDIKQRLISPRLFQAEVNDLKDSLTELLDRAAIHRRSPVDSYSRTRRPEALEEDTV